MSTDCTLQSDKSVIWTNCQHRASSRSRSSKHRSLSFIVGSHVHVVTPLVQEDTTYWALCNPVDASTITEPRIANNERNEERSFSGEPRQCNADDVATLDSKNAATVVKSGKLFRLEASQQLAAHRELF